MMPALLIGFVILGAIGLFCCLCRKKGALTRQPRARTAQHSLPLPFFRSSDLRLASLIVGIGTTACSAGRTQRRATLLSCLRALKSPASLPPPSPPAR